MSGISNILQTTNTPLTRLLCLFQNV